jgi:signal transduction histidine kinase
MLATAWCLYPLAVARAARVQTLVLVLAALPAGLAAVTAVPADDADGGGSGGAGRRLVVSVGALSVSWFLGLTVGRQTATAREAERARVHLEVARDVHDVVGQALGLISAEAGVTRSLPDAGEQELRDSLADVEAHARRALEQIQALVRSLRSDPASGGATQSDEVTAGVRQLPSMITTVRASGIPVESRISVPEHVDDTVGAVVYRVVQESLNNVIRHASGASCAVDVHEDGDIIVVRVRDHGAGSPGTAGSGSPSTAGSGFGLQGCVSGPTW